MLCYVKYSSRVTLNYYICLGFSTYFFKSASPIQACEQSQKNIISKSTFLKRDNYSSLAQKKIFSANEKILFYHFESGHVFTKQI